MYSQKSERSVNPKMSVVPTESECPASVVPGVTETMALNAFLPLVVAAPPAKAIASVCTLPQMSYPETVKVCAVDPAFPVIETARARLWYGLASAITPAGGLATAQGH